MPNRCAWAGSDPLYHQYHDAEWGVPVHDDQKLFEFLILEGMQAGLSWITILKKRQAFKDAYDQFDVQKVAMYDAEKVESLMQNAGIIRNHQKILASIQNAQGFIKIQREFGSFDRYIWDFVDQKPIQNHWQSLSEIPASTTLSAKISKDLVQRGFRFVGPTIIYAHMQATGMVNDHTMDCFRYSEVSKLG